MRNRVKKETPIISYFIMGFSHLRNKQIVKGIIYILLEICFVWYMITTGVNNLVGLVTLGTNTQGMVYNEVTGIYDRIPGDNSMRMLLSGVVSLAVIVFYIFVLMGSVSDADDLIKRRAKNLKINSFGDDIKSLLDGNIHKLLLFLPMIGLIVFTVLPLVYMILMAFTNYDVNHQPPGNLFDWVGMDNFEALLSSTGGLASTFWPVLGWTLIWAFFATFTNYFLGMALAMLINAKGIKFKKFWRTIFVITIAIPSFVSLMLVRTMLHEHGVLNIELISMGFIKESLPFLTNATWAKVTVIVANMWIGIPYTMLITTGILTNIPAELYESAKIDGAGPLTIFRKITFPYMLFITTPYLISNFISNVNNFNPIYFLTEGGPLNINFFKGAGSTDLLVTWLYKLTKESMDYCYASAIGIVIFVISAVLSIVIYRRSNAYNNEEEFQL